MLRFSRLFSACAIIALWLGAIAPSSAASISGSYFGNTWAYTDQPVATGLVNRTWMWGPSADSPSLIEPYAESPGGQRTVQYFDKTRMEITHPDGDSSSIWYVSNGLLAEELITGRLQLGDNTFEQHDPAQINVAGDANDPNGPTYATFNKLMSYGAIPSGWIINQTVNRAGTVGSSDSVKSYNVTAQDVGAPTKHNVASVFWDFMNSSGTVDQNGTDTQGKLFINPFYATGYPLTEAYWTNVLVGGVSKQVLVQVFERRVLTYTPSNPDGWKVEAGNVGQHYYTWRYTDLGKTVTDNPNPPAQTDNVAVSAWVSDSAPSQNENVTVYGSITDNGQPISGVTMDTEWQFKTTNSTCSGVTGSDGTASCARDISDATPGYTVTILATFTWNGTAYTTNASFTTAGSSSPTVPANATAVCKDGTISYSQHASGTCSGHGGVAQWINKPSS